MAEGSKRPICAVVRCETQAVARGWCNRHYQRWRKHGDPGPALGYLSPGDFECTVDGCTDPQRSIGLCQKHYMRQRKHGDVHKGRLSYRNVQCAVEGCERPAKGLGYCTMHYARVRRDGHPGGVEQIRPETRRRTARRRLYDGYVIIPTADGSQFEHRVVMAEIIGRPLGEHENVHTIRTAGATTTARRTSNFGPSPIRSGSASMTSWHGLSRNIPTWSAPCSTKRNCNPSSGARSLRRLPTRKEAPRGDHRPTQARPAP